MVRKSRVRSQRKKGGKGASHLAIPASIGAEGSDETASMVSHGSDLTWSDSGSGSEVDDVLAGLTSTAERVTIPLEALSETTEQLSDRSKDVRTHAALKLTKAMAARTCDEFLENHSHRLGTYLSSMLRKGMLTEACRAAHGMGVAACTLGPDGEQFAKDHLPALQALAKSKAKQAKVRGRCLQTMAILAFCCLVGEEDSEPVRLFFQEIWFQQDDASVVVYALEAWMLLTSLKSTPWKRHSSCELLIRRLVALLENSNLMVRCAAGANLALLYDVGDAATDIDDSRGPPKEWVLSHLRTLATDGSRSRAKRDRRTQRARFRDILDTVENGTPCITKMKVNGDPYEFEGWAVWSQLGAFRAQLGSGFQFHLTENPLLRAVFEVESSSMASRRRAAEGLTKKDKQQVHDDAQRDHQDFVKGQRSKKNAFRYVNPE